MAIDVRHYNGLSGFGLRLEAARKKLFPRRIDAARVIGVGVRTLESWEHGRRWPPLWALATIAHEFKCSTDYLIDTTAKLQ